MRRVLVTGANGFIGRYVAKEYSKNFYVIGIGHGEWKEEEYQFWGINEWHCADITIDSLKLWADGADLIIHCAGSGSVEFSITNPMKDFERTVWTTYYVLEYIRVYSPHTKLIYPSSAAVYGNCNDMPISENTTLKPISPYGVHKKLAEELCRMYAETYKVQIMVFRLFSVYGNGLKKQIFWDACKKLNTNKNIFWGTGQESRDFIHVSDVAKAMLLVEKKMRETYTVLNLASGTAICIQDLLKLLFKAYGSKLKPCFGGEKNEGNPIHYWADIKAIKAWGWQPKKQFFEGIEEYVRWYKEYD